MQTNPEFVRNTAVYCAVFSPRIKIEINTVFLICIKSVISPKLVRSYAITKCKSNPVGLSSEFAANPKQSVYDKIFVIRN